MIVLLLAIVIAAAIFGLTCKVWARLGGAEQ
jgi:hypothetical protein